MEKSIEQVKKFMEACGQGSKSDAKLYLSLIDEEYEEFYEAYTGEEDLKEICDLIWVLIGYAQCYGYDLAGAFDEVARSNMSKIDPETGVVLKREDGKVKKPPSYSLADVRPFV